MLGAFAQNIDRLQLAFTLEVPVRPPVTSGPALNKGAKTVNRPLLARHGEGSVGLDLGADAAAFIIKLGARLQDAEFDDGSERYPRFCPFGGLRRECRGGMRRDCRDAFFGGLGVVGIALDADEAAPEALGDGA